MFEVTVGSSKFPRRFHPKVSKGLSGFNDFCWPKRATTASLPNWFPEPSCSAQCMSMQALSKQKLLDKNNHVVKNMLVASKTNLQSTCKTSSWLLCANATAFAHFSTAKQNVLNCNGHQNSSLLKQAQVCITSRDLHSKKVAAPKKIIPLQYAMPDFHTHFRDASSFTVEPENQKRAAKTSLYQKVG